MAERTHLHPRVKLIWLLPAASLIFFLLLVGLVGFLIAPNTAMLGITFFNFFYVLPLLAIIMGASIYSWIELIYRNFTYELDENEIVIRQGVFDRRTTVIPYAAIQDITTVRSAIERLLGIATVEIETAGSMRLASEITLPGIAEKDLFVRELTHRVEKAKGHAVPLSQNKADENARLLSEILSELKAIESHLAAQSKNGGKHGGSHEEQKDREEMHKHGSEFQKYEHFKKGPPSS